MPGSGGDAESDLPLEVSPTVDESADHGLVSVIIPTYREAANLTILVPLIAKALADAGLNGEILIIDDNSQDGTDAICQELAVIYPLQLIIRTEKRGSAGAVLHGMSLARGTVFVVMDADLSHPPEKIPELVATLASEPTDFVLGSRHPAGGQTAGLLCWLNSKFAALLVWPLTNARDPMTGFFALRRATYAAAGPFDPIGNRVGLELMVRCGCRAVKEVAISNRTGAVGDSLAERIRDLVHLLRLYEVRYQSWMQLLQFVFVGASGVAVDLCFFTLFMAVLPDFTVQEYVARGGAIGIAMSWNFLLNRHVTFRFSRKRSMLAQYALFCLSCSIGALINWSTFVLLRIGADFFEEQRYLAALAGIVAGTGFNFAFSKWHVFAAEDRLET
jgi:dolichol-phosphate mannosyltransferase